MFTESKVTEIYCMVDDESKTRLLQNKTQYSRHNQ